MKSGFLLFCFVLVITSCQKENEITPDLAIPAETLNNVSYGSDAAQKMDIYLPAGRKTDSTKMVIMVHGGAWIEGDKNDFNSFVQSHQGVLLLNDNVRSYCAFKNFRCASVSGC